VGCGKADQWHGRQTHQQASTQLTEHGISVAIWTCCFLRSMYAIACAHLQGRQVRGRRAVHHLRLVIKLWHVDVAPQDVVLREVILEGPRIPHHGACSAQHTSRRSQAGVPAPCVAGAASWRCTHHRAAARGPRTHALREPDVLTWIGWCHPLSSAVPQSPSRGRGSSCRKRANAAVLVCSGDAEPPQAPQARHTVPPQATLLTVPVPRVPAFMCSGTCPRKQAATQQLPNSQPRA
jgi:hypothetical protein